jgi:hypothetical protein
VTADAVAAVIAALRRLGQRRMREEMAPRYGIYTNKVANCISFPFSVFPAAA